MEQINYQNRSTRMLLHFILLSIALHILFLIGLRLYQIQNYEHIVIPKITPQDTFTMYINQPQPVSQPKPQPKQVKPQIKPPEITDSMKKLPTVVIGKQGINHQNLDHQSLQGIQSISEKTTKNEPPAATTHFNHDEQKNISDNSEHNSFKSTPLDIIKKYPQSQIQPKTISSTMFMEKSLLKETAPLLSDQKATVHDQKSNQKESTAASFQDIGLEFDQKALRFGNSKYFGIDAYSPDIAEGEELKHLTFLNQLARQIIECAYANPYNFSITNSIAPMMAFSMTIDRNGKLIDSHIVLSSKNQPFDHYWLNILRKVGLFTQIPQFIQKNTFTITWKIRLR